MKFPSQFTLGEIEYLLKVDREFIEDEFLCDLRIAVAWIEIFLKDRNKRIASYVPPPVIDAPKKPKQERKTYHFTLTD